MLCLLLLLLAPTLAWSADFPRFRFEAEVGPAWQSRNDLRIPGDTGSTLALTDFSTGPFFAYRFYLSYRIAERHTLRALVAPFNVDLRGTSDAAVSFNGVTFAPGALDASYKFNSYRLAYFYTFPDVARWDFGIGFSAKIRDARVTIADSTQSTSYTNIGFVPLLVARIGYHFSDRLRAIVDFEGLAAPQGRAFDVATRLHYKLPKGFEVGVGYRMVEGGVDNDKVYNFTWLHYAVFNLSYEFL